MPFGLGFFAVAGAGGGVVTSFDLLETQILGSGQASVSFSSLSQYSPTYKHFQVRMVTRTNRSGADSDPVVMRFNGDSGANYATHGIIGYNIGGTTAVASNNGTSTNHAFLSEAMPTNNSAANSFGGIITDILNPFETTQNKTIRSLAGMRDTWNSAELRSGVWLNTAAISSITILPLIGTQLVANSRFSLYGVKG